MIKINYTRIVFFVTGTVLLLVGGVNYIINPLGAYNSPVFKGFNDVHPAAVAYSRIEKTESVKRLKPEIIISGSSRADIGLDPRPEFFGNKRVYNFALSASSIKEQRYTLEFAQAVHPLETAIITLDFFSFNAHQLENKSFNPERLSPEALSPIRSFLDTYETLLSLDTINASLKHLRYRKRLDRHAYSLPNGRKMNNDVAAEITQHGAGKMFVTPPNAKEIAVDNFSFEYSDREGDTSLKQLEYMLDFCRLHHIQAILLISPVHANYLKSLEKAGKMPLVEEWKTRVKEIVQANSLRYRAKAYPLWDFSYPNSITSEPIPQEGDMSFSPKWFWDSNHYKVEVGDIVLRKILNPSAHVPPLDFGKQIP